MWEKLAFKKKLIIPLAALIATAIALTAITAAVMNTQQFIPANGSIRNVVNDGNEEDEQGSISTDTVNLEIYVDSAATTKCTSINWETLNPGGSTTRTVYVKNTENVAETLSMSATEWNPQGAGSVLTLTWDKEGASLPAGAIVAATLTLQVSSDVGSLTSFSLNIVISGSG